MEATQIELMQLVLQDADGQQLASVAVRHSRTFCMTSKLSKVQLSNLDGRLFQLNNTGNVDDSFIWSRFELPYDSMQVYGVTSILLFAPNADAFYAIRNVCGFVCLNGMTSISCLYFCVTHRDVYSSIIQRMKSQLRHLLKKALPPCCNQKSVHWVTCLCSSVNLDKVSSRTTSGMGR